MKTPFFPTGMICLLILGFLTACQSYDPAEHQQAIDRFNRRSQATEVAQNAAIRILLLSKSIKEFPDNEQAVEDFCRNGLPKNDGHLRKWHQEHAGKLKELDSYLSLRHYAFRYDDIKDPLRLDSLYRLANLVLTEAALHDKGQDTSRCLSALIRALQYSSLVSQAGTDDDFRLSHYLHLNASLQIRRLIPRLNESELKQLVVACEEHYRRSADLNKLLERITDVLHVKAHEYIKPQKDDSFWNRLMTPSADSLSAMVQPLLDEERRLIHAAAAERCDPRAWKAISHRYRSANQFMALFHLFHNMRNSLFHAQSMKVENELNQYAAAWQLVKGSSQTTQKQLETALRQIWTSLLGSDRQMAFVDLFTGESLKFRHEPSYTVIWSYGGDLKDQGGLEAWNGLRGDILLKIDR